MWSKGLQIRFGSWKKFWIADASLGGRGLWKRLKAVDVNKIPKREPKGHNQLLLNDLSVYVFKSLCLLDKYTEMFTRKVVWSVGFAWK